MHLVSSYNFMFAPLACGWWLLLALAGKWTCICFLPISRLNYRGVCLKWTFKYCSASIQYLTLTAFTSTSSSSLQLFVTFFYTVAGSSYMKVAREYNIPKSVLWRRCQREGIFREEMRRCYNYSQDDLSQARRMLLSGCSLSQIVKDTKVWLSCHKL